MKSSPPLYSTPPRLLYQVLIDGVRIVLIVGSVWMQEQTFLPDSGWTFLSIAKREETWAYHLLKLIFFWCIIDQRFVLDWNPNWNQWINWEHFPWAFSSVSCFCLPSTSTNNFIWLRLYETWHSVIVSSANWRENGYRYNSFAVNNYLKMMS